VLQRGQAGAQQRGDRTHAELAAALQIEPAQVGQTLSDQVQTL
jgi:hypothetical protein